jgi:hypothetical protein
MAALGTRKGSPCGRIAAHRTGDGGTFDSVQALDDPDHFIGPKSLTTSEV